MNTAPSVGGVRNLIGLGAESVAHGSGGAAVNGNLGGMRVEGLAAAPTPAPGAPGEFLLTDRQRELSWRWSHYRCTVYKRRARDWYGHAALSGPAHEDAAALGHLPPGYVDSAASSLPLSLRKPTMPTYLVRDIVDRFTGLLFSEKRHPRIRVPGDPRTEDWLNTAANVGRLWASAVELRNQGGGMGAGCLGFQIIEGRPAFEVLDPRWCFPTFDNRHNLDLVRLEVRYLYAEWTADAGAPEGRRRALFWYRRVVTPTLDAVWERVACTEEDIAEGREPRWADAPCEAVEHGMGLVPYVWVPNTKPEDGKADGDPDAIAVYDDVAALDRVLSAVDKAILNNLDPTPVVSTDADVEDGVSIGGGEPLVLTKGDSASYLEITGAGIKIGMEKAEAIERRVQRKARVVLDRLSAAGGQGAQTATEVREDTAAMYERADVLREQYGELGIKRILQKLLKAARALEGRVVETDDGGQAIPAIVLPPAVSREQVDEEAEAADALGADPEAPALDFGGEEELAPPGGDAWDAEDEGWTDDAGLADYGAAGATTTATAPSGAVDGSEADGWAEDAQEGVTVTEVTDGEGVRWRITTRERVIGDGEEVELEWPGYTEPTAGDIQTEVTAAVAAKDGGILDREHAARRVAPFYGVENVSAMIAKMEREEAAQAASDAAMMGGMEGGFPPEEGADGMDPAALGNEEEATGDAASDGGAAGGDGFGGYGMPQPGWEEQLGGAGDELSDPAAPAGGSDAGVDPAADGGGGGAPAMPAVPARAAPRAAGDGAGAPPAGAPPSAPLAGAGREPQARAAGAAPPARAPGGAPPARAGASGAGAVPPPPVPPSRLTAAERAGVKPGSPVARPTLGHVPAATPLGEQVKIYAYELEDGLYTINEARAAKGFGPLLRPDGSPDPDGNLTVPVYKSRHRELFATAGEGKPKRGGASEDEG